MTADPYAKQCPICKQQNQCSMAEAKKSTECWCMTEHINTTQLPEAIRQQDQCICYTCAMRLTHTINTENNE